MKVNFFKSELIRVRATEEQVSALADILGCKVGGLSTSYLGLPLCAGKALESVWNPVVERVDKRLAVWKGKYLLVGGRVTLIHSILANLPVYFMSKFKCPASVVERLEKLQRDFLWHDRESKNEFHLVDWKSLC